MPALSPVILSATFAAATVGLAGHLSNIVAREFLAILLGITAGVYLGFAVLDGRPVVLAAELAGSALFLSLTLLGLRVSPFFLAGGFLLHGAWDALHHPQMLEIRMAGWFRPACILYDAIIAIYIYVRWRSAAEQARVSG